MAMRISDDGNIFTPKSEPLSTLLGDIHAHKIVLPNFQRPWVWEPQMVRELLISVAYRYPAGSLLTMPVTGQTFALRAFEGTGDLRPNERSSVMVLDGQQRLTSLYQALYHQSGVEYRRRRYHFYLDVAYLLGHEAENEAADSDAEPDVADALFFVMEEKARRGKGATEEKAAKRVRYDGLQPRYELTSREDELAAGCLPLNVIFDADGALSEWQQDYLDQVIGESAPDYRERLRELQREWNRLVKPWLDRIRTYPFPVVELRADMPLGAICHIFEKVNSTGVPLDVFDLCTAIFWAKGFHLNETWAKTRQHLERSGILAMQPHPLSGTYFLQGISLLESIDRKRANPAGRIAVACRKQDLMNLSVERVRGLWDVLVEGYKEASRFLTNEGILSERILPYTTLILPLSAIFADLIRRKGHAHVGAAWPHIRRWYWCSVFSQRYSSQVESAAAQDFEQVLGWVDGVREAPDVVRTFTFRPEALQEITSIRNAIYKGVLCLLARDGAKDFGGGGKLTTALFYDTQQDHHHIFPTAALKQMGIADPRMDTILNKTLISASVNRSIGDRRPSVYTRTLQDRLGSNLLEDILTSHRIQPNALGDDAWEAFLENRREQLRLLIADACGEGVQQFTTAVSEPAAPLADFDEGEEDEEEVGA